MTDQDTTTTEPQATSLDGPQSRRWSGRGVFLTVIVVALLVLPLFRPWIGAYNYVLQVGIVALMWVTLSSSWNIIGGFAGYISLGHNVFFGIGAYVSGMLLIHTGFSPLLSSPLAGVVASISGLLFGLIALRTRGPYFIISTIALLLMVFLLFDEWSFVGGFNGVSLPLPPFPIELLRVPFYYAMLVAAAGSVYLGYRIQHSKFGLGLRAIAQDEVKAEAAGIDTRRFKIIAFSLSAFFVGMSGAIWGYALTYLRPITFFTIAIAANMVLMAIIGGRGTVAGPVVGALLLVAINEFSVVQFGGTELNIVVTGVILVVVLLFFPQGIVGTLREQERLPSFLDWD